MAQLAKQHIPCIATNYAINFEKRSVSNLEHFHCPFRVVSVNTVYPPRAEVEQALRVQDEAIMNEIEEAKHGFLDRVKIFPSAMSFRDMSEAMRECEDYWQQKPRFVMVDFLEQLPGASGYEGVSTVLKGLKDWAETENLPVGLVHQSGKGSTRGTSRGMDDGKFNAASISTILGRDIPRSHLG